jgi:hypothetical protein
MVSSTTADLRDFRKVAAEVIQDLEFEPATQDNTPGDGVSGASSWSLDLVDQADYFIGIVAYRYGEIAPTGNSKSYTELEYDRARARRIPCHMFLLHPDVEWKPALIDSNRERVEAFRARVSSEASGGLVANFFRDANDFRRQLTRILRRAISSDATAVASNSQALRERLRPAEYVLKNARREIRGVERLKAMHDAIHRILQFVVRPLCDSAQWLETTSGSAPVEESLRSAADALEEDVRRLDRRYHADKGAQSHTLRVALRFLQHEALNDIRRLPGARPDPKALRDIALKIEKLISPPFTELAENLWKDATPRLIDQMDDALKSIDEALSQPGGGAISESDRETVRRFVKATVDARDDLKRDMSDHNGWQQIHDELTATYAATHDPAVNTRLIWAGWRGLHSRLVPLLERRHESRGARTLSEFAYDVSRAVEACPTEPSTTQGQRLWEAFLLVRTEFEDEFFEVDSELKQRCQDFLTGADEFLEALGMGQEARPARG